MMLKKMYLILFLIFTSIVSLVFGQEGSQQFEEFNLQGFTEGGEKAWKLDVEKLQLVHRHIIAEMMKMETRDMDEPVVQGFSSLYATLHGLIQHNLYHAGQMALLKKIVLRK